ncbi:MAG: hypothetical protein KatS3mg076_3171 [Candidatus Binatia bacterium]|nr:MAG: hypothetical protein KatS3mg076_3171 [Candidatus Binatia bacterium]
MTTATSTIRSEWAERGWIEAEGQREVSKARRGDRAPGMPLLGFLVGGLVSGVLWGLIGLGIWAFFA